MPELALPIEHIGPSGADGSGSEHVDTARPGEFKRIQGEVAKPKPMIPPEIRMSEVQERRLVNYLSAEIEAARVERSEYIRKLERLRKKYQTKFPELPKDYPIANSSQLTIPIIKTAVNTLSARLYQTVMAADPMVSIRTEEGDDGEQFTDFAHDLERFVQLYDDERLELDEVLDDVLTETIKLGTSIVEVTNRRDFRSLASYDPLSQQYTKKTTEIFNGPIVYHVPIEDFWIRPAFHELQTAPWCGKAVRLTWSQIKDMAFSGEFDPDKIDRIWRHTEGPAGQDVPATVTGKERDEKMIPQDRDLYTLFELNVRWDFDGDGMDEEAIVYFHAESLTLLRRKFNGFRKGRRQFIRFVYVRVPHWFYGEGLAETLEHLQEEISTVHNQRLDNASLANLQIILVRKLIQGLSPGDRLWTGKIVRVSDVNQDVGTLRLGETYPSTTAAEQMTMQYIREAGGATEVTSGTAQPVSRTTATAQMAMLEELNRRYDKILKGFRKSVKAIHVHTIDLFAQQGTGGLAEQWLGPTKGRRLEEYLQRPEEVIGSRLKVQVRATKSTVNREVEFQTQVAVMNLLIQMFQQIFGLAQQLGLTDQLPVLAHEFVVALRPVLKKIMQYGDAADPDQMVSVLAVLERILPPPEDFGGMAAASAAENADVAGRGVEARGNGTNGNGARPSTSTPSEPDVGNLLSLLGQAESGRGGLAGRSRNGR